MKHNPEVFYKSSCHDIEFKDYLLLGGGTDINPSLYGEKPSPYSQYPNIVRDRHNIDSINRYINNGKPIFGICRGFQLLDAVFGGKLIQHTTGHSSLVPVFITEDKRLPYTRIDNCRSCHHQVVDTYHTKGQLVGHSNYKHQAFLSNGDIVERDIVPQILYWPEKKALAVQFHPEWHGESHSMNKYLRGLIKELLGLENVL